MDVPNINKMISTTNHFWANVAWLLLCWDVDWMSTSIDQEMRDNHKLQVNFQIDFKLRNFTNRDDTYVNICVVSFSTSNSFLRA